MQPNSLKLIFNAVAFVEAIGLGLIPVYVKSFKENPAVLGVANSFSGGVFLAIAMLHIMPEMDRSYDGEFPLPSFLLLCGYTLILAIDKVLFDPKKVLEESSHSNAVGQPVFRKTDTFSTMLKHDQQDKKADEQVGGDQEVT